MIFEENISYYQEKKVPVRIIKRRRREPINSQGGTNFGFLKTPLKRAGKIFLILLFLSSQVYLASAFEAHVVNVTAHICGYSETRTMGFWKNHFNAYKNCLPQWLGDEEIGDKQTVTEVFDAANADVMRDMLKGQLLAMKFNICYFGIETCEGEEFEGHTLNELVNWADNLLRDPNSSREEQELAKNLLDYANNAEGIRYCSTPPVWYNPSFAKKAEKEEELTEEDLTDELLLASLQATLIDDSLDEEFSEEPPAEEPPAEEPPAEEPPAEEPPAEEPPAEEPPAEEPPAEEPPAEEPPLEEPPVEEPLSEEPPTEEPPAEEPPAEEPPAEEPPAEEPPSEEPPVEEPPAEEPPAEEPPAEEPPAEEPPAEEPPPPPAEEPPAE